MADITPPDDVNPVATEAPVDVDSKVAKVEKISDSSSASDAEQGHVERINLNNNLSAKIKNPLADLTPRQVLRDVREFAQAHDLVDILPSLEKGALVARDPANFAEVEGLTEEESLAIQNEVLHKWRQPLALYFTIILCSVGAAVQGWDQEGSNGANLSFPDALGIPESGAKKGNHEWLVGTINSAPYIASALFGCWLSDPMNRFFARRGTIFTAAIFCLLSPIGGACAQTWQQLFITRLLLGIGMGLKASTIPIFCAENVPAAIRGGLVMSWQMWTAFGIFLGCCANLAVMNTGKISWRLQLGSAFIPAIPLLVGVYFCPESPRWHIRKGNIRKAFNSLKRLRNHEVQAARDLYYIYAQIQVENEAIGDSNYISRFIELFTVPRIRRATLASGTVMLAQQMCGINIIAFYSSTVFTNAGATAEGANWASWGFGLINFLFAIPAIFTIDTYGRRTLLLFTFPNMAWSLLTAGLCFLLPYGTTKQLACVATFIYIFVAFYSPGEGPVPFTYSAEVFPLSHREVGMSFAVATCLGWAAVLSISFPRILTVMTPVGAFGFYAGLNVTAFVLIYLFVPETKQRTLEELDYIFAVPTRRHISYQLKTWAPWWYKHYILRQDIPLEPLYHFDHVATYDVKNVAN